MLLEQSPSESADGKSTAIALRSEVQFTSAFVASFAAAVAAELEDFGLVNHKVDEILLRSAKRFGVMSAEASSTKSSDASAEDEGFFARVANFGGQASDYLASMFAKYGPRLWDEFEPLIIEAVIRALHEFRGGARPWK